MMIDRLFIRVPAMGMKLPLVVLSFVLCASGGVLAGEDALVPDTAAIPLAQSAVTPAADWQGAREVPSARLGLSWAGPIALSVSERLQLRDEIRKAAQDIYSEPQSPAGDGNDAPRVVSTVSP